MMKHWHTFLLVGLAALVTGWMGHWIGGPTQQSFAQDTEWGTLQVSEEAAGEDRGWIGLMVEDAPNGGIQVANVFPGGPSAFAGIRQGDVILKAGEIKVQSEAELAQQVEQWKPGTTAVLVVRRGERELPLKVDVGSLRNFHGNYVQEMMRRVPRDPGRGHETIDRLFQKAPSSDANDGGRSIWFSSLAVKNDLWSRLSNIEPVPESSILVVENRQVTVSPLTQP